MDDTSVELLKRFRGGDPQAAEQIFLRYVDRLAALVRPRLSAKMAQRIDPEDVIQSVYRSFFLRARQGRFEIRRGGDLWRLLVEITLHKLLGQVEHHRAKKRSIDREATLADDEQRTAALESLAAREPSPQDLSILVESLERLMSPLGPLERQSLEMRLQGYRLDEIATAVGRSERTVRRWLVGVKERLQEDSS